GSSYHGEMDQPVSAGPSSPRRFSRLRTPPVGVCDRESAAIHSARVCCHRRSAWRQHFGLPYAGLDVDGRVLAGGSDDAWRSVFFQYGERRTLDERIHWILL